MIGTIKIDSWYIYMKDVMKGTIDMLVLTGVTGLFHACAGETSSVTNPTIWSRYANFELLLLFNSLKIDCFHTQYGFDCFHSQWSKTLCFQEYCYIPVASLGRGLRGTSLLIIDFEIFLNLK